MIARLIKLVVSAGVCAADSMTKMALAVVGKKTPGRAVILYYHAVPAHERGRFAAQMDELVSCAKAIPADFDGPLEPGVHHAVVTFDDGFVSVLENALPELQQRKIPAVIFVPSGYIGEVPGWVKNPHSAARQECVMTVPQLMTASQGGLVIGSHTVKHPRLDKLPKEEAFRELAVSKQDLEAALKTPITLFSFPHGAFTPEIMAEAKRLGYQRVFGIQPTCEREKLQGFFHGRVAVNPDDWPIEFALKVRGAYRWRAKQESY